MPGGGAPKSLTISGAKTATSDEQADDDERAERDAVLAQPATEELQRRTGRDRALRGDQLERQVLVWRELSRAHRGTSQTTVTSSGRSGLPTVRRYPVARSGTRCDQRSDVYVMSHADVKALTTPLTSADSTPIWLSHSHGMTYACRVMVRSRSP